MCAAGSGSRGRIPVDAEVVERHLEELLAAKEFRRAPKQSRALALMVRASLRGEVLHGHDMALALDAKADENYIKAFRNLAREIRLKLPLYYATAPRSPVRFVLDPNSYSIRFEVPADPAPPVPGEARAESATRWVLRAAVVACILLALAATIAWRWGPGEPAATVRIDRDGITVRGRSGRRLPVLERRLAEDPGASVLHNGDGIQLDHKIRAIVVPARPPSPALLVLASYDSGRDDATVVRALDARTAEPLGEIHLPLLGSSGRRPRALHGAGDGEEIPLQFPVVTLEPVELDGDGAGDEVLVVVNSRRSYPSEVLGLDFDGRWRVLLDYWYPGNVGAAAIPDRDGNGADEVVVYGQDNGDQGAVVVILRPAPGTVLRGRMAGGRRHKVVAETEAYPVLGYAIRFPRTALRRAGRNVVRDMARRPLWRPGSRVMAVRVKDAGRDPATGRSPTLTYLLDVAGRRASVRFDDYDLYLRVLTDLVERGLLEDRWGIRESESLDGYGRYLASRIECRDASRAGSRWERFVSSPGTTVTR